MSPDQALALLIDANLSSNQYNIFRNRAKQFNCELYPLYHKVVEAKKMCYPSDITVNETSAEIPVQPLIDHTVRRICLSQKDVLATVDTIDTLTCIMKWGCDGSEQIKYKQKSTTDDCCDGNLFSISMVPIQIYYTTSNTMLRGNKAHRIVAFTGS